jgi:hypothetical protein
MNRHLTRRNLMQVAGTAAFAPPFAAAATMPQWPIVEGPDTPKICLGGGRDEAGIRRVKQLGVNYVLGGAAGPTASLPWQEANIRAAIDLENSFPNTIYGRPGRDAG